MIVIFIGPPYSGKGTQAGLLGKELDLPVFSMGDLIKEAYKAGNPKAIEGFENYSMKGLHVPISLKFDFLKKKMEEAKGRFILDNFPATSEDLNAFQDYFEKNSLVVDRVFYINISKEEMLKRLVSRGRSDDTPEIVAKRRENQDRDRVSVIEYFKSKGLLEEINGEGEIDATHREIIKRLGILKEN